MLNVFHIVFNTIFLDEVSSTNDYAQELLAKSNPNEGTVISTHCQTKGKGQIGRVWFSDAHKNLSLSVILKPYFVPLTDSFYLSMMLALSIRDLVYEETKVDKVPNILLLKRGHRNFGETTLGRRVRCHQV